MKRYLLSVLLSCGLAILAAGSLVLADTIPPVPSGFVNDYAGILTTEERTRLETKLTQFEAETSNEIAVVTIKSLEGDVIENIAESVFSTWGIGKENNNNGVLLLIAVEDRAVRIEVGYGLEPVLTDVQSSWIIREQITPAFQAGDYNKGISDAIEVIMAAAKKEFAIPTTSSKETSSGFTTHFLVGFLMLLAMLLRRSKSYWLGGAMGLGVGVLFGILFRSLELMIWVGSVLGALGLAFDYVVSKGGSWGGGGSGGGWTGGSGGSSSGGRSSGSFGGGRSGGGGSSGRW